MVDIQDPRSTFGRHVRDGLSKKQKAISSAYFYDDAGSALFQRIMKLPEYYLTRIEFEILRQRVEPIAEAICADLQRLDVLELGCGDGEKAAIVCNAFVQRGALATVHAIDVSPRALQDFAAHFAVRVPKARVAQVTGNYFDVWPAAANGVGQVAMFLGSNLGNFTSDQAGYFLRRVRAHLRSGDKLIIGLDLRKDPRVIEAAYADSAGVTAQFNKNLLMRMNRELGMNFDITQFAHFATYCPLEGVARSFLVSTQSQRVASEYLESHFDFAEGETIYLEQSQKYAPEEIASLCADSGFAEMRRFYDDRKWYAVSIWSAD